MEVVELSAPQHLELMAQILFLVLLLQLAVVAVTGAMVMLVGQVALAVAVVTSILLAVQELLVKEPMAQQQLVANGRVQRRA